MFGPNSLLTLSAVSTGFSDNIKWWLDEFSSNIKYCVDWILCYPLRSVWTEFSDINIKYCLDWFCLNSNRYCLDWSLTADWIDFLITLSNIWNEFSDNIKSCFEWYLWQCSLISNVWTELSDNFKYRLNSVVAFSTAWIELSHSICLV